VRQVERFKEKCLPFREPFYVTRMVYDGDPKRGRQKSCSEEILGYDVQIELVADDLSTPVQENVSLPLVDFFTCCHMPHGANSELAPYLAYAFFFDTLQTALSGPGDSTVFFVGYPLNCLGWRHFLQIYLRPVGVEHPQAAILRDDWQVLHDAVNWPVMKHFLEGILHQVHVSAFQHYFLTQVAGANPSSEDKIRVLERSFCSRGNWLFPVLRLGNHELSWMYEKDIRPVTNKASIWTGYKWVAQRRTQREAEKIPNDCINLKVGGLEVVAPKLAASANSYIDILQEGRFQLILEEQLELAQHIQDGAVHRTLTEVQAQEMKREESIRMLWGLDAKKARALSTKVEEANKPPAFTQIKIPTPNGEASVLDFMSGWWDKPNTTPAKSREIMDLRSVLLRILGPTIPSVLSEYLDVGPVKSLTHLGAYYIKDDRADNLKARFQRVTGVFACLPAEVKEAWADYLVSLAGFHDRCLKSPCLNSGMVDAQISNDFKRTFKVFAEAQFTRSTKLVKAEPRHLETKFRLNFQLGAFLGTALDALFSDTGLFRLRQNGGPTILTWAAPSDEKYPGVEFWGKDGQDELKPTLYLNYTVLLASLAHVTSQEEVVKSQSLRIFAHATQPYGRTFILLTRNGSEEGYEITHGRSFAPDVSMDAIFAQSKEKSYIDIAIPDWISKDQKNIALVLLLETWRQK
jgi:hypothetical protein